MSFRSAAENIDRTTARNKIDRLLAGLPADEGEALLGLLRAEYVTDTALSRIIRQEAENADLSLPSEWFQVSDKAVSRWREKNGLKKVGVTGL